MKTENGKDEGECRKRKTILEGVTCLLERVVVLWCHVHG